MSEASRLSFVTCRMFSLFIGVPLHFEWLSDTSSSSPPLAERVCQPSISSRNVFEELNSLPKTAAAGFKPAECTTVKSCVAESSCLLRDAKQAESTAALVRSNDNTDNCRLTCKLNSMNVESRSDFLKCGVRQTPVHQKKQDSRLKTVRTDKNCRNRIKSVYKLESSLLLKQTAMKGIEGETPVVSHKNESHHSLPYVKKQKRQTVNSKEKFDMKPLGRRSLSSSNIRYNVKEAAHGQLPTGGQNSIHSVQPNHKHLVSHLHAAKIVVDSCKNSENLFESFGTGGGTCRNICTTNVQNVTGATSRNRPCENSGKQSSCRQREDKLHHIRHRHNIKHETSHILKETKVSFSNDKISDHCRVQFSKLTKEEDSTFRKANDGKPILHVNSGLVKNKLHQVSLNSKCSLSSETRQDKRMNQAASSHSALGSSRVANDGSLLTAIETGSTGISVENFTVTERTIAVNRLRVSETRVASSHFHSTKTSKQTDRSNGKTTVSHGDINSPIRLSGRGVEDASGLLSMTNDDRIVLSNVSVANSEVRSFSAADDRRTCDKQSAAHNVAFLDLIDQSNKPLDEAFQSPAVDPQLVSSREENHDEPPKFHDAVDACRMDCGKQLSSDKPTESADSVTQMEIGDVLRIDTNWSSMTMTDWQYSESLNKLFERNSAKLLTDDQLSRENKKRHDERKQLAHDRLALFFSRMEDSVTCQNALNQQQPACRRLSLEEYRLRANTTTCDIHADEMKLAQVAVGDEQPIIPMLLQRNDQQDLRQSLAHSAALSKKVIETSGGQFYTPVVKADASVTERLSCTVVCESTEPSQTTMEQELGVSNAEITELSNANNIQADLLKQSVAMENVQDISQSDKNEAEVPGPVEGDTRQSSADYNLSATDVFPSNCFNVMKTTVMKKPEDLPETTYQNIFDEALETFAPENELDLIETVIEATDVEYSGTNVGHTKSLEMEGRETEADPVGTYTNLKTTADSSCEIVQTYLNRSGPSSPDTKSASLNNLDCHPVCMYFFELTFEAKKLHSKKNDTLLSDADGKCIHFCAGVSSFFIYDPTHKKSVYLRCCMALLRKYTCVCIYMECSRAEKYE